MKKKLHFLWLLLLLPLLSFAQSKVNASVILDKINRGEAVTYRNATITGDLNLTQLKNMKLKTNKGDNSSKEYLSTVTAPLTFINCTFTGDVLAYFNPATGGGFNAPGEVYNTNFKKPVQFQGCTFKQESAFKYTELVEGTLRSPEEAFPKHSKF